MPSSSKLPSRGNAELRAASQFSAAVDDTKSTKLHTSIRPEFSYREASPEDRRRLADEVVAAFKPRVTRFVAAKVPGRYRRDAEQAGVIGLLIALDRYQLECGAPFWAFAVHWVKDEVQKALGVGFYWRARPRNKAREAAMLAKGVDPVAVRKHASIDDEYGHVVTQATAEDLLADAEAQALLHAFVATLSEDDAHLLLCEKRERVDSANKGRARRYQTLVEQARAYVLGEGVLP